MKIGRKTIGTIYGYQFVKIASTAQHMLRDPKGWALDIAVLEQLRKARVAEVVVIDEELNKMWTAPLESYFTYGVFVDRGSDPQSCLPIEYWQVNSYL